MSQAVSPTRVLNGREPTPTLAYTLSGTAFGASDCVSDDVFGEPGGEDSADVFTIDDWLSSIALQNYAAAIKEFGYDSFQALDAASEEQIKEMAQDPSVAMKKPHRNLLLLEWKKRVQALLDS